MSIVSSAVKVKTFSNNIDVFCLHMGRFCNIRTMLVEGKKSGIVFEVYLKYTSVSLLFWELPIPQGYCHLCFLKYTLLHAFYTYFSQDL